MEVHISGSASTNRRPDLAPLSPGLNVFRLELFGSASIDGPGGPVTGRAVRRHRLGLLALLAMAGHRGMTRDKLAGYLWPDADGETVSMSLVYDDASEPVMRISGPPAPAIEQEVIERWRAELLDNWSTMPQSMQTAIADLPHRASYPGFEALVVAGDGSIWIGSFAGPGQAEREWLVLAADGRAGSRDAAGVCPRARHRRRPHRFRQPR